VRSSRLRVPLGYAFGLLALYLATPSPRSVLAGLPFVVTGEAVRLWASGHIEKTVSLATGGPYAHTRNPLYVGSLLLGLGIGLAAASPPVIVALVLYFALFYPAVIAEEAAFLRGKFGAEYAGWAGSVPLFLPRLRPAGPRASRFLWTRVRTNREWRTALAVPLALLLLGLRAWLRSTGRLP
jgi:Phospholipid methyltransferase